MKQALKEQSLQLDLISKYDDQELADKSYSWIIEDIMDDSIFIKLNFTDPLSISEAEIDRMRMTFTNTELLFDMFGQTIEEGTQIEQ